MFTDGASRGNPGPAAVAYLIRDVSGRTIAENAECIGIATNNEAEYRALIVGLRVARDLGAQEVCWTSDSQLAVRQMSGTYRVKDERMKTLHREAVMAADGLTLVPEYRTREDANISRVDALANAALDGCT